MTETWNSIVALFVSFGAFLFPYGDAHKEAQLKETTPLTRIEMPADLYEAIRIPGYIKQTASGNYLVSRFAQMNHDWEASAKELEDVLAKDEDVTNDYELRNRLMVLYMGSGAYEKAIELAQDLTEQEKKDADISLALLFSAANEFKNGQHDKAKDLISRAKAEGLYTFIEPLMKSWIQAANGKFKVEDLDQNVIHIMHAVLIADYLDQPKKIRALLDRAITIPQLSLVDYEGIADAYTLIGEDEIALKLYEKIYDAWPENRLLGKKVRELKGNPKATFFDPVETSVEGFTRSLFKMASLLYQGQSDESARVFASLGLYLDPKLDEANILMAYILARHNQYDQAIAYHNEIDPGSKRYLESQRMAADFLQSLDRDEEAITKLKDLFANHNDLESLIMIGDIHRNNEEFEKAVEVYDTAIEKLGNNLSPEYWQLLYVRGISHERNGDWDKAETDFLKALEFQPEHPLILNYLGYAWADQGRNLDQALEMIRKAVNLRPDDGHIIDSLGWVLFRLGQYEEALPHIEKAAELLPYDPIVNDHLGDVYWSVNRKSEARFQWRRALSFSEDNTFAETIHSKLENGLVIAPDNVLKEAHYSGTTH